jgi:exodeoxyribonuclease-3
LKIVSWNVNGIRKRHAELVAFVAEELPDIICLQEIKATFEQVPEPLTTLSDYFSYWHAGPRGYSGVSLHFRRSTFLERPSFSHPAFDMEGRFVEAALGRVAIASVYVPNGGKDYAAKLAFLRALQSYVADAERRGRLLLLCGDMNVARSPIDVHPAQRNERLIGQRADERRLLEELLEQGLVDVGRALCPDDQRYFTWWPFWKNAKANNIGWRLDYLLASRPLAETVLGSAVRRSVGTSDHAPIVFECDPAAFRRESSGGLV